MIIFRKTILRGTPRILTLEGLGKYEVELTSNSVIIGNVEILTKNLKYLPAVSDYGNNNYYLIQPLKTDVGYIVRKGEDLVLINSEGDITLSVKCEIIFILKILSARQNKHTSKLDTYPFVEGSYYGFLKTGLFSREDFKRKLLRRGRYVKYSDTYLTLAKDYEEIVGDIISVNGPGNVAPEAYMKHIIESKLYTKIENRKFIVYNSTLIEISGNASRLVLPVALTKLKD